MTLRNNYLSDLDELTKALLYQEGAFNSRQPLCSLTVPPSAISPDGTEWLHSVDAIKKKTHHDMLCIRVITNTHRGVNVLIPLNTVEMYYKYLDLRFQIRNQDKVLVTFPKLYVQSSSHGRGELYLLSYDFKVYDPNTPSGDAPEPAVYI